MPLLAAGDDGLTAIVVTFIVGVILAAAFLATCLTYAVIDFRRHVREKAHRCPHCDYDLRGHHDPQRCPECGVPG